MSEKSLPQNLQSVLSILASVRRLVITLPQIESKHVNNFNCRYMNITLVKTGSGSFVLLESRFLQPLKISELFFLSKYRSLLIDKAMFFLVDMDVLHSCACCCVTMRFPRYIKSKMQIREEKGQRRTFYERADNLLYRRGSRDSS